VIALTLLLLAQPAAIQAGDNMVEDPEELAALAQSIRLRDYMCSEANAALYLGAKQRGEVMKVYCTEGEYLLTLTPSGRILVKPVED
jgi:hypothetical protein